MISNEGRHIRRSEAQWREIFAAHEASGLSQAAFCRREGLALSTFAYWKRRLAMDDAAPASESGAAVIDLGALDDRPAGWEVEIALGEGVSLTLRRR
ncbi:IS66 family insertion sequence element accessory protein TnpA [Arhodomonas sp. AD133]|uniref:IS66 family insertion sequence element accessory protein TnpA n=1 Tax=Arhodomonas sp. AD133 TaxID=3415009 RepID=UPI003EB6F0C0